MYNHALEDDISSQVVAREDPLIRQYREMQAEQMASRARRAAVNNIKRSDDDADREYREYSPISLCYSMTPVPLPHPFLPFAKHGGSYSQLPRLNLEAQDHAISEAVEEELGS